MPWHEVTDIQNALEYEWKVGARFYKVPTPPSFIS